MISKLIILMGGLWIIAILFEIVIFTTCLMKEVTK